MLIVHSRRYPRTLPLVHDGHLVLSRCWHILGNEMQSPHTPDQKWRWNWHFQGIIGDFFLSLSCQEPWKLKKSVWPLLGMKSVLPGNDDEISPSTVFIWSWGVFRTSAIVYSLLETSLSINKSRRAHFSSNEETVGHNLPNFIHC